MPEATSDQEYPSFTFWQALGAAQSEFPIIGRDTSGQAGSHVYKYAPLDTIWPEIRETLAAHGLVWSCTPTMDGDRFVMRYALMHSPTGDGISGSYPLPEGRPQEIGSALTYARRYALCAVLGLVVSDDDDDGRQAQSAPPVRRSTEAQSEPDRAEQVSVAIALLKHVGSMEDLRAAWGEVGRMGLQTDPAVKAAKDARKAELG